MFGCLAGFVLGLIAGLKENIRRVLEHMRWLLMSVPPVVLEVVCMIWFGMGSAQTLFATSLLILTIRYVNTITGIEPVASQILEMEGGAEKFYNYYNYIRNATCIVNKKEAR